MLDLLLPYVVAALTVCICYPFIKKTLLSPNLAQIMWSIIFLLHVNQTIRRSAHKQLLRGHTHSVLSRTVELQSTLASTKNIAAPQFRPIVRAICNMARYDLCLTLQLLQCVHIVLLLLYYMIAWYYFLLLKWLDCWFLFCFLGLLHMCNCVCDYCCKCFNNLLWMVQSFCVNVFLSNKRS